MLQGLWTLDSMSIGEEGYESDEKTWPVSLQHLGFKGDMFLENSQALSIR